MEYQVILLPSIQRLQANRWSDLDYTQKTITLLQLCLGDQRVNLSIKILI